MRAITFDHHAAGATLQRQVLVIALGTLALTASSWLSIPSVPVPITMQTYVVLVTGALLGPRLGTLTVIAWLAEALVGMPVLAQGASGILPFAGPTAGYLFSFPVVAALAGFLMARRGKHRGIFYSFGIMLGGNAVNLFMGALWLATTIGWHRAFAVGVLPFLAGALAKACMAAITIDLVRRNHRSGPEAG